MKVQLAREKYRPDHIKVLFIAEAPPCSDDRFFYFDDVQTGDSLFLHIIREVFPELQPLDTKSIRSKKEELLYPFMEEGYFLEDSVPYAIPKGTSPAQKIKIIKENQSNLLDRISPYKTTSKLVLLSSTVFKANYEALKKDSHILNDFAIPFPDSGQQGNFKTAFRALRLNDL